MSSVASFIPSYPDVGSDNFTYDLSRKKELADLALKRDEGVPENTGDLLNSQIIMKRIFSPHTQYKKALIFQGMGSGKCIHPDTALQTSAGLMTAKSLWEFGTDPIFDGEGEWADPTKQINVWSYNEAAKAFITAPINKLYRQHIEEPMVVLTLEDGSSITITLQHRLFNGVRWYNDFKLGDIVCVPKFTNSSIWQISVFRGVHPSTGQLLPLKIVSIQRYIHYGYVYDFEIEKHHNYVANDVLCHNTCVASAIVENFKKVNSERALVLVKNDVLKQNYYQEIAKVCTSGIYEARVTKKEELSSVEMSEDAKQRRLNRDIATAYQIETFETFLKSPGTDAQIKERYSGRVIIVDEVHGIRKQRSLVDDTEGGKKKGKAAKSTAAKAKPVGKPTISLYKNLHRFLHAVEDCIIILLTGTPIWDQTSEIASTMNLILDLDEQLPTGSKFDKFFFDSNGRLINSAALRKAFHGKLSFLRSSSTSAERIDMGITAPYTKYRKIYPLAMSKFQAKYAQEAKDFEVKKMTKSGGERVTKGGAIYNLARDAANMVIPKFDAAGKVIGGAYGKEAIKLVEKYTSRSDDKTGKIHWRIKENSPFAREMRNNLAIYSVKFAKIIEDIKAHPNEITFVYNEVVGSGAGGIMMFAMVLELHGLKWMRLAKQIEHPSGLKRFVVLTGEGSEVTTKTKAIKDIIESSNRPDNSNAGRLQVIIGSRKVGLGISLYNVRRVFENSPNWNVASEEQAVARAFRFGGHDALPENERKVRVFALAAVEEGDDVKFEGASLSKKETIDVYIYRKAEEKDYRDSQIYAIAKEEAFDCALNYERNVLPTDKDGSRACNYGKCNYICSDFPKDKIDRSGTVYSYKIAPEDIDRTTYDLFYADKEVEKMVGGLVSLFGNFFSLSLDAVIKYLDVDDDQTGVLFQAIDHAINSRVLVRNRYGFGSYLKEQGDMLFLDTDFSLLSNYVESAYVKFPLIHQPKNMDDLVDIMTLEGDAVLINKFCDDPTDENFDLFSHTTKVILIETAYAEGKKGSPIADFINKRYGEDIHTIDGNIYHIINTKESKGTAYDVAAKEIQIRGDTRVFEPSTRTFKSVTDPEKEKQIIEKIKIKEAERKEIGFEGNKYGVFAWTSKWDPTMPYRVEIHRVSKKGKKGKSKGMDCNSFEKPNLIDIFIERLGYLPPASNHYKNTERSVLIKNIKGQSNVNATHKEGLDKKSDEELKRMLTLFSMTAGDLCEELKAWFIKNNLMFRR